MNSWLLKVSFSHAKIHQQFMKEHCLTVTAISNSPNSEWALPVCWALMQVTETQQRPRWQRAGHIPEQGTGIKHQAEEVGYGVKAQKGDGGYFQWGSWGGTETCDSPYAWRESKQVRILERNILGTGSCCETGMCEMCAHNSKVNATGAERARVTLIAADGWTLSRSSKAFRSK